MLRIDARAYDISEKEFTQGRMIAPIIMEILGHKKFELPKVRIDELFSNVLDCDIGLGSNPNTLIRIGVVVAYHRGCDNRRFTRSGRTLNHDDSIVVLIRQYPLDGCALRGIKLRGD